MRHKRKRFAARSPPLLSALTAEPKFAVTVVWFVARNHSAIIATTTMSQIIACESLLNLSTQHRDVGRLHRWLSMNAAAIQKGHTDERAAGFRDMGTFRCDQCGESFFLVHTPLSADMRVAERQVHWLEKVLAEGQDLP
jgi:hypothetical protein